MANMYTDKSTTLKPVKRVVILCLMQIQYITTFPFYFINAIKND